jgi:hypothetical protein
MDVNKWLLQCCLMMSGKGETRVVYMIEKFHCERTVMCLEPCSHNVLTTLALFYPHVGIDQVMRSF